MRRFLPIFLELIKIRISAAVSLTALMGGLLYLGRWDWELLWAASGTFCMAGGASALNQAQDRRFDALMERTRSRPLPSGRIGVVPALTIGATLILCGGLVLLAGANPSALALGLFAVFWYNIAYVFLKRRSAFAVVPGAWIGAVPPLIGWVAAGGRAADPRILAVAFFVGVWQVPHFWLLMLLHGEDYDRTGLPSLRRACTPRQLTALTLVWILATVLSSLGLLLFGSLRDSFLSVSLLALLGIALLAAAANLLRAPCAISLYRRAFWAVNFYALGVLLLVCWSRLW